MKLKAIILPIVTLAAVVLVLTACQPQIGRSREVEDDSSALLGGLIQDTDFSGEWRWIREGTMQHAETPTTQNQQMLESALRTLRGDYGLEKYYFTIAHSLNRYQQDSPQSQIAQFQSGMGLTNTTTLSLNLVPLGESMSAKCWKSSNPTGETVCNVAISYPHLLSSVVVYAPVQVNDATLMEILNRVLSTADSRIKAMDK